MRRQRGIIWPMTRSGANMVIDDMDHMLDRLTILASDEMTEDARDCLNESIALVQSAKNNITKALNIQ